MLEYVSSWMISMLDLYVDSHAVLEMQMEDGIILGVTLCCLRLVVGISSHCHLYGTGDMK